MVIPSSELERVWKEAVLACLKYDPSICQKNWRKLRKKNSIWMASLTLMT